MSTDDREGRAFYLGIETGLICTVAVGFLLYVGWSLCHLACR